ncbi:MAG: hypothetical protein COB46_05155 [Rhodospirillaceae bacterium]|nr:MAG: hypothetical protein COB46_05155 [Rhodospirillaceae bacterium]
MVQALGIIGFFLSFVAIFIAVETMRRSDQRQRKLETELFKANLRVQDLEHKFAKVERLVLNAHNQKKRQAETLTSMAEKAEIEALQRSRSRETSKRFTPSGFKSQKTG